MTRLTVRSVVVAEVVVVAVVIVVAVVFDVVVVVGFVSTSIGVENGEIIQL